MIKTHMYKSRCPKRFWCYCGKWLVIVQHTQHEHAILSQSIRISIIKTEQRDDGMVPPNSVLPVKSRKVSCRRFAIVDGIVPVSAIRRFVAHNMPVLDGTNPYEIYMLEQPIYLNTPNSIGTNLYGLSNLPKD